ncbi:hypothetical protein AVEN_37754-1 [Araneus ventricosus]|uniref:Uncharacterized protein n=1 Tax=Araneus ventricosus TaxID=182803 RepID=A0A4Y2BV15_ARAVE|nr:hypothetical protein AVEN_37754-1 [Araneus ventricosus]
MKHTSSYPYRAVIGSSGEKKEEKKTRVIAPLSSQGQALSAEDAIIAIVKRSVCLCCIPCKDTRDSDDWTSVICMTTKARAVVFTFWTQFPSGPFPRFRFYSNFVNVTCFVCFINEEELFESEINDARIK